MEDIYFDIEEIEELLSYGVIDYLIENGLPPNDKEYSTIDELIKLKNYIDEQIKKKKCCKNMVMVYYMIGLYILFKYRENNFLFCMLKYFNKHEIKCMGLIIVGYCGKFKEYDTSLVVFKKLLMYGIDPVEEIIYFDDSVPERKPNDILSEYCKYYNYKLSSTFFEIDFLYATTFPISIVNIMLFNCEYELIMALKNDGIDFSLVDDKVIYKISCCDKNFVDIYGDPNMLRNFSNETRNFLFNINFKMNPFKDSHNEIMCDAVINSGSKFRLGSTLVNELLKRLYYIVSRRVDLSPRNLQSLGKINIKKLLSIGYDFKNSIELLFREPNQQNYNIIIYLLELGCDFSSVNIDTIGSSRGSKPLNYRLCGTTAINIFNFYNKIKNTEEVAKIKHRDEYYNKLENYSKHTLKSNNIKHSAAYTYILDSDKFGELLISVKIDEPEKFYSYCYYRIFSEDEEDNILSLIIDKANKYELITIACYSVYFDLYKIFDKVVGSLKKSDLLFPIKISRNHKYGSFRSYSLMRLILNPSSNKYYSEIIFKNIKKIENIIKDINVMDFLTRICYGEYYNEMNMEIDKERHSILDTFFSLIITKEKIMGYEEEILSSYLKLTLVANMLNYSDIILDSGKIDINSFFYSNNIVPIMNVTNTEYMLCKGLAMDNDILDEIITGDFLDDNTYYTIELLLILGLRPSINAIKILFSDIENMDDDDFRNEYNMNKMINRIEYAYNKNIDNYSKTRYSLFFLFIEHSVQFPDLNLEKVPIIKKIMRNKLDPNFLAEYIMRID